MSGGIDVAHDGRPVEVGLYVDLQRFMYREVACLDNLNYDAWFALFASELKYMVIARTVREAGTTPKDYAIIDDRAPELKKRIEQIRNPKLSRAENPPSLTRRLVTNVEAYHGIDDDDFMVESTILVSRARGVVPEGGLYVGRRHDILRRTASGFEIRSRAVRLDQAILFDGALSTLL